MKAKNVKFNGEELLDKIKKARSGGNFDPDIVKLNIGEGKPASNVMRPIGDFVKAKLHYLRDYIGEDAGVSRSPVCPGRQVCPVCAVATQLFTMGTEESKQKAKDLFSSQRIYWNVLPRWEYEWDERGEMFKVLSFGINALRSLEDVVANVGSPSDLEEGFDINYEVEKKKGGYGNDTKFVAVSKRKKTREGYASIVSPTPFTEEELEYEIVDLSKYTEPPDAEGLELLADIFSVDVAKPSNKKRRSDADEEDADDDDGEDVLDLDDSDEDEDDDDFLCFGDGEVFDAKTSTCKKCPYFLKCRKEVRKELLGEK